MNIGHLPKNNANLIDVVEYFRSICKEFSVHTGVKSFSVILTTSDLSILEGSLIDATKGLIKYRQLPITRIELHQDNKINTFLTVSILHDSATKGYVIYTTASHDIKARLSFDNGEELRINGYKYTEATFNSIFSIQVLITNNTLLALDKRIHNTNILSPTISMTISQSILTKAFPFLYYKLDLNYILPGTKSVITTNKSDILFLQSRSKKSPKLDLEYVPLSEEDSKALKDQMPGCIVEYSSKLTERELNSILKTTKIVSSHNMIFMKFLIFIEYCEKYKEDVREMDGN